MTSSLCLDCVDCPNASRVRCRRSGRCREQSWLRWRAALGAVAATKVQSERLRAAIRAYVRRKEPKGQPMPLPTGCDAPLGARLSREAGLPSQSSLHINTQAVPQPPSPCLQSSQSRPDHLPLPDHRVVARRTPGKRRLLLTRKRRKFNPCGSRVQTRQGSPLRLSHLPD